MKEKQLKIITILTPFLAISLAIASYFGAFIPETYKRETASMAAQGIGQDMVDLFFIVPLLLVSLIYMRKGSLTAFYIFGGTLFYILYSFVIYSMGVHFNNLFLIYCLTFGLSLFTFIVFIGAAREMKVHERFRFNLPMKSIGIYLILIAIMFYFIWLKEIVPALVNNTVPKSVNDYNLLVNPVHVVDISIVLPGLIISSVLLMKKHSWGFVFAPISLVFIILMAVSLAAMVVSIKSAGENDEDSIAGIFIILAVVSMIFLLLYLRSHKKETPALK